MTKIGSSGSGDNPLHSDKDEDSFESHPWKNLSIQTTDSLANAWFEGELDFTPIDEVLSTGKSGADESYLRSVFSWMFQPTFSGEGLLVPSGSVFQEHQLGEPLPILSTVLGRFLTEKFDELGLKWSFCSRMQVGLELIDLDPDNLTPELHETINSQWPNMLGSPILQNLQIHKDSVGKEYAFWYIDALVSTRTLDGINYWDSKLLPKVELGNCSDIDNQRSAGDWARELFIPLLAKKLFYLAETPFPSNKLASFSRDIGWSEVAKENRPKPLIVYAKNSFAQSIHNGSGPMLEAVGCNLPEVVKLGWAFTTSNTNALTEILTKVTNGLNTISGILEDGYKNYNQVDFPAPWEWVTLSMGGLTDLGDPVDLKQISFPEWLPGSLFGKQVQRTKIESMAIHEAKDRSRSDFFEPLLQLAAYGVSDSWASCANTLIYGHLLKKREWDLIEHLALKVYKENIGRESTNALINSAIALYLQGKYPEAERRLLRALDSSIPQTEAEACFWLAKTYQANGKESLGAQYQSRCDTAGGHTPHFD